MTWDGRPSNTRQPGEAVGVPSAANLAITFPRQFASPPSVWVAPGDNASDLRNVVLIRATVTTSGFTVQCWNSTGGAISGLPVRICYIAEVIS
jgi:hypothetical protein